MIYLKDVSWERIHMELSLELGDDAEVSGSCRFCLADMSGRVETEFKLADRDGRSVRLSLNVTNNGLNSCVENGTYRVLAVDENGGTTPVLYEGSFEALSDFGRSFVYNAGGGVYSVSFMTDEFSDLPELRIILLDAKATFKDKENPYYKLGFLSKLKRSLKKAAGALNILSQRVIYSVVRAFRFLRKPHILFLCEKRDELAPNMSALYDRMLGRGLDKKYAIEISARNTESRHYSKLSTAGVIVKIARADVIIVDDYVPAFNTLALADSVRVIQIWHAGVGFKGVGYSRWGHFGCPPPFSAHRRNDFAIAASKEVREVFSEPFGILEEQVIPTGMPRMDDYLSEENRALVEKKLYESYPSFKDKNVILFAPTYRGRNRKTSYYPYELIDFEELYRYCEDTNSVVMFKMHPWIDDDLKIDERYSDRFYSMSGYPNINDLFYITDLLITDYSSCIYEFMLMKKPMLFFAYDLERYSVSRGFHRDYASNVPGKIVYTFDELLRAMREEDYEFEKVDQMLPMYFDHIDSHSSDRVIDWLVLGDLPEEHSSALRERREAIARTRALKLPEVTYKDQ